MHLLKILIALVISSLSVSSQAQTTIYTCETDHGTVFSQQPCSTDSGSMKKQVVEDTHVPDPDSIARLEEARDSVRHRRRVNRLDREQAACFRSRTASARAGANQRIHHLQQLIADANARAKGVLLNTAGIQYVNETRTQIRILEGNIADEKRALAAAEQRAKETCANARRSKERQLQQQTNADGSGSSTADKP